MAEIHPTLNTNRDDEIMPYISSCNLACGFHSGTPQIIERSIDLALKSNVKIGAHPSYNDRENFGRKSVETSLAVLIPEWRYQIIAVKGMTESLGGRLHHVKPHGALYNDMARNEELAVAFIETVQSIDPQIVIFGMAQSIIGQVCDHLGMSFFNEVFADRVYIEKNQLMDRSQKGSVLVKKTAILNQIDRFLNQQLLLNSGQLVPIEVDTICLHSDTQGAVSLSKEINQYIRSKGIEIR